MIRDLLFRSTFRMGHRRPDRDDLAFRIHLTDPGAVMRAVNCPRVKICCIRSLDEVKAAVDLGASALGLVSEMPSGPGVISETQIRGLAGKIPPGVASFLLTSKTDPDAIVRQQRFCRVNTVQLCDRLEADAYAELHRAMPGVGVVQVVHVTGPEALEEAQAIGDQVHALLLDSGNADLAVKELGGTGRTHDWEISCRIREESPIPVWLAGGLKPSNVAEAIAAVGPFGVDVCTGVRTEMKLDEEKLTSFFTAVQERRKG